MDIKDASVLVTGGAGGFGSATARRLAEKGARVVIADLARERGEALAKELGNGAVYAHTNIMEEDSIAEAVDMAANLGPLRAAVVVHGGPPPPPGGRLLSRDGSRLSFENFSYFTNVYLNSAFIVSSRAAEAMAKNDPLDSNQRGVIINTASIAGYEANPGQVGYGAAKAGIIGMTQAMARDLAPVGIRSVSIAPGTFLTLAYKASMTDEQAQERFGGSVLNPKRMGDPDEYAKLAEQIVDNDFLNMLTIRLDGGQRFQ